MLDHRLHPVVVIAVGMGLDDELEGLDLMPCQELEECVAYAILLGQIAVDQPPSVARQSNEDGVPVPAVEKVDIDPGFVRIRWVR
jgi:hypothetical protein